MSSLDKFTNNKKQDHRLVHLLKNTFIAGMEEMEKQLSHLFNSPATKTKHQVSAQLEQREQELKQERTPLSVP